MVKYACAFSQSELRKYFEWIIRKDNSHLSCQIFHDITETMWNIICRVAWQRGLEPSLHDTRYPQFRNLAEWDRVPIFFQNKYGRECSDERTMIFGSVLSFPSSKHQEKVLMNFFNGMFGHQEAWCMNSSWVTSLFEIRHLGKFSYL